MCSLATTNIYVLLLRDEKRYVGKAEDVTARYELHMSGRGAMWTKLHHPVKIESVLANASPFDEDRVVKEQMLKYGIENVRGGSYSQIILTDEQIKAIQTELWAATDKCIKCGRDNHFAAKCDQKFDVLGKSIDGPTAFDVAVERLCREITDATLGTAREPSPASRRRVGLVRCFRCGRRGHLSPDCYATTNVRGSPLVAKK